jgi:hypothetical protein
MIEKSHATSRIRQNHQCQSFSFVLLLSGSEPLPAEALSLRSALRRWSVTRAARSRVDACGCACTTHEGAGCRALATTARAPHSNRSFATGLADTPRES